MIVMMPMKKSIIDQMLATPVGRSAYEVAEKLTDAGFEAYFVGGGVRDMLLEKIPKDIDIATSATPDQILEIFPKVNAYAAKLGNIFVNHRGETIEVTTFREDDTVSDGRHPESVKFTTEKSEDAKRRDITINALYFQPISGELFDPFDGEKDVHEKLIKFIGDPATRIQHDALRIVRVVRFRALIDGQYDPLTYQMLREKADAISILSGYRILGELEKILMGPNPARALEDLWELGVMKHMIPELYTCKGIAQPADYHKEGDVWDHTLKAVAAALPEHTLDARIATLFHDIGKTETFSVKERIRFDEHASVSGEITEKILTKLQVSAKRKEKILWLIKHHMMMGSFLEMNDERKAHWYFHLWFPELLQVFWLDIAGTDPSDYSLYKKIVQDFHLFLDAHPAPLPPLLTGKDIMETLHLKPGERVGEILEALHDAQIRKEVTTKREALTFITKFVDDRG